MFYVQHAPLGVILDPLKSVLVLFLLFCTTNFIRQKHTFFQKGPFPPTDLAESLCVEPQTLSSWRRPSDLDYHHGGDQVILTIIMEETK